MRRPGRLREASRQSTRAPRAWSGTTGASPSAESPPPSRRVRRGSPGSPPVVVVKIGQHQNWSTPRQKSACVRPTAEEDEASAPRCAPAGGALALALRARSSGVLLGARAAPLPAPACVPGCAVPSPPAPLAPAPTRSSSLSPSPAGSCAPRAARPRQPGRPGGSRALHGAGPPPCMKREQSAGAARPRPERGKGWDETCSFSTGVGTRRVRLVRGGGRGEGVRHPVRQLPSPDLLGPRALLLPPRLVPPRARTAQPGTRAV